MIRLLSVAWDVSPEEAMLKLIVERLEDYQGQSLQFFTGAIEN